MNHSFTSVQRRQFLAAATALSAGWWLPRPSWAQEANPLSPLKTISETPLVCEANLAPLIQHRITPVDHFFIRNNGNVPVIDAATHRVSIGGLVSKPLSLGLEEIRRYKKQEVEALLMCAGNRRLELNAIKKVTGTAWGAGGLGNALWGGVPLRELLLAAGVQSDAKHVWFEGLDEVKSKDKDKAPFRFGGSIPLSFVMDAKQHEPLLCYEMNEQPLTVEHGAPLRIVVPGVIGARSVKWLSKITLSERESPNPILQHSYKLVASADTKELEQAAPLYTFPVNGYICTPAATAVLPPGKIKLAGYAMATGAAGAVVKHVSLRVREGKTWPAKLLGDAKPFAWQLWEAEVELGRGEHEIALNVTDSLGKSQPDDLPWNYLGYLNNGQQRLTLRVG